MNKNPGAPDPTFYIHRLGDERAFHREAAAWTLGGLGSLKAARPLAGLLIREVQTVERSGYLEHSDVVRAAAEAIRRLGATDALYAVLKALCVLSRAKVIDEPTVEELVDCIADVGGPNAVREATDRVVSEARRAAGSPERRPTEGLRIVGDVLLGRLSLCGDAAVATLRRLANGGGPRDFQPIARRLYASV